MARTPSGETGAFIRIAVSPALKSQVEQAAAAADLTIAQYVRAALRDRVARPRPSSPRAPADWRAGR